jgi:predicted  nucleic acid-binding Zn-ribbon protein
MLKYAASRSARSKQRQALNLELDVWVQRERDMEVAIAQGQAGVPEKVDFIRQEQTKLRKALRGLDRGFGKQRAWSQGKLQYT